MLHRNRKVLQDIGILVGDIYYLSTKVQNEMPKLNAKRGKTIFEVRDLSDTAKTLI